MSCVWAYLRVWLGAVEEKAPLVRQKSRGLLCELGAGGRFAARADSGGWEKFREVLSADEQLYDAKLLFMLEVYI